MERPVDDSDEDDEDRVVIGSVRMSVWVVGVVVTSTLTDEEDKPVVTVVVSIIGADTDVSVLVWGVEVTGTSCACAKETGAKIVPIMRYQARSWRVLIWREGRKIRRCSNFDSHCTAKRCVRNAKDS